MEGVVRRLTRFLLASDVSALKLRWTDEIPPAVSPVRVSLYHSFWVTEERERNRARGWGEAAEFLLPPSIG